MTQPEDELPATAQDGPDPLAIVLRFASPESAACELVIGDGISAHQAYLAAFLLDLRAREVRVGQMTAEAIDRQVKAAHGLQIVRGIMGERPAPERGRTA